MFAMSNDQLTVIGVAAILIAATFTPSVFRDSSKTATTNQQMLRWTGVVIAVLTATSAVLYLEIIKLNNLLMNNPLG